MCNYSLNTATIGNILVIVIEVTYPYTCIHIYIHTYNYIDWVQHAIITHSLQFMNMAQTFATFMQILCSNSHKCNFNFFQNSAVTKYMYIEVTSGQTQSSVLELVKLSFRGHNHMNSMYRWYTFICILVFNECNQWRKDKRANCDLF